MILGVVLSLNQKICAQINRESTVTHLGKTMVAASYRYQNGLSDWDIEYYGVIVEFQLTDDLSISAPFYVGKGLDDLSYLHLPIGGIFVALLHLKYLTDDGDGIINKKTIKFLITENIKYNIWVGDRTLMSPYLSLCGYDVSNAYGSENDQNALLSNGLGLDIKILPIKNLTLGSSFSIKHFISLGEGFRSKHYLGYSVCVYLGYTFK